mgnify:CR=1 FL=1
MFCESFVLFIGIGWINQGLKQSDMMTHKYRGSIVVLLINKSVEPNEEQKEMTIGFQQGNFCKHDYLQQDLSRDLKNKINYSLMIIMLKIRGVLNSIVDLNI